MKGLAVEKIRGISKRQDMKGAIIGKIVEIDHEGTVLIDFPDNRHGPIAALVTAGAVDNICKCSDESEMTVLIVFENEDIHRPVIIDVVSNRIKNPQSSISLDRSELDNVKIDSETITFDAKKEIVLRCGKSSITLTKAGKVLIRGAYLLNRSSGVNRIKGGSVQIN